MIHQFYKKGHYIVLDVDTSTLMTVDEMTYHLIEDFLQFDQNALIARYAPRYGEQQVKDAIVEIQTMIDKQLLFTDHRYDPAFYHGHDGVKALCLHIAHDCNLKCDYCFASQGDFKGERSLMSLEVGKKAIDFVIEASKHRKNIEIDFFGGEPLMNFDVVKGIVDYARKREKETGKRFNFTMTTNGVLLDQEKRDYLNDTMQNVVLSLDGRKEVHDRVRKTLNDKGSYDVISENILAMVKERGDKEYYVRGTYTKYNMDFSEDVTFLAEQGIREISIEPVVAKKDQDYAILKEDLPRILEEYDILLDKMIADYREQPEGSYRFFHYLLDLSNGPCVYKRLSGCGAGNDYLAVTPEGDLYPCHQFVGEERFKLGTLDTGLEQKEMSVAFKKANLLEKEDCQKCWCKYFCGGGCHANAYNFNQTLLKPYDVACEIEKKRVENALTLQIIKSEEH
ncbi:MAG: thioether cross-link-forming SCIFF peptide maturase [Eubacteriaceae bacterium]|nr:thioether cross-link-forming SCIFF peptide maturase [Eubacteriaceae bacterium]